MRRAATMPSYVKRAAASPRVLMLTSVLATLGMLAVCAAMLFDLRRDAWERADHAAFNVLQAVASDIARNVELYDLSLQAAAEGMTTPAVVAADPLLRHLVLFDRAATARGLGAILVIDPRGNIVAQSQEGSRQLGNLAEREYFRVQQDRDAGLFISQPFVSRLTGEPVIALSRRITGPGGRFAGVVAGTIKLNHLDALFDRIDIGGQGAVALFREDGTVLRRKPLTETGVAPTLAGSDLYRQTRVANEGRMIGRSAIDGVERAVTFRRVGGLPLFLSVATGVEDIVGPWRTKAIAIGLAVLALAATTIGLSSLFRREIERRARAEAAMTLANAELATLSVTDALTGLANRRRFDAVLEREHRRTQRVGCPLSLLVLDADHFKTCNDLYGHATGDVVLRGLARAAAGTLRAPGDLACRIGGEEFAVVLPDTDLSGAAIVAEAIHRAVARLPIPGGEAARPITVSIGIACTASGEHPTPAALFASADAALYAAKRHGRNCTEFAEAATQPEAVALVA